MGKTITLSNGLGYEMSETPANFLKKGVQFKVCVSPSNPSLPNVGTFSFRKGLASDDLAKATLGQGELGANTLFLDGDWIKDAPALPFMEAAQLLASAAVLAFDRCDQPQRILALAEPKSEAAAILRFAGFKEDRTGISAPIKGWDSVGRENLVFWALARPEKPEVDSCFEATGYHSQDRYDPRLGY